MRSLELSLQEEQEWGAVREKLVTELVVPCLHFQDIERFCYHAKHFFMSVLGAETAEITYFNMEREEVFQSENSSREEVLSSFVNEEDQRMGNESTLVWKSGQKGFVLFINLGEEACEEGTSSSFVESGFARA